MAREKRLIPAAAVGAKGKHRKLMRDAFNPNAPPLPSLVAKPLPLKARSKHVTYLEFVANENKKDKKLKVQMTSSRRPPSGFEFVPIGNPDLTKACKEISRERGATIYIVSDTREHRSLVLHMHRVGHHVQKEVVREARLLNREDESAWRLPPGVPEPLPLSQADIFDQADRAIRDLFPRIPNTDREIIVEHAFKKGQTFRGEPVVGLSTDLSLSRRVQLAVLAHIRHTHTRYDKLLKETSYHNARRLVEPICLDILVKWRGDEENGRDELDEILREVVVISDDSDRSDSSDDGSDDEDAPGSDPHLYQDPATHIAPMDTTPATEPGNASRTSGQPKRKERQPRRNKTKKTRPNGATARHNLRERSLQKGFKRYAAVKEAAMNEAWNQAVGRQQQSLSTSGLASSSPAFGSPPSTMDDRLVRYGQLKQSPAAGGASWMPRDPRSDEDDRFCQRLPPPSMSQAPSMPPGWLDGRKSPEGPPLYRGVAKSDPLPHAAPLNSLLRDSYRGQVAAYQGPTRPYMDTMPRAMNLTGHSYRDLPVPPVEATSSGAMGLPGRGVTAPQHKQYMSVLHDSDSSRWPSGLLPPLSVSLRRESFAPPPVAVPQPVQYGRTNPTPPSQHGYHQAPSGSVPHAFSPSPSLSSGTRPRPLMQPPFYHSDLQRPYLSSGDREHPIVIDDDRYLMGQPAPQTTHNNRQPFRGHQQPFSDPHSATLGRQRMTWDRQPRTEIKSHEGVCPRSAHMVQSREYRLSPVAVSQWVSKPPVSPPYNPAIRPQDATGNLAQRRRDPPLPTANWELRTFGPPYDGLQRQVTGPPAYDHQGPPSYAPPHTIDRHTLSTQLSEHAYRTRRSHDMILLDGR